MLAMADAHDVAVKRVVTSHLLTRYIYIYRPTSGMVLENQIHCTQHATRSRVRLVYNLVPQRLRQTTDSIAMILTLIIHIHSSGFRKHNVSRTRRANHGGRDE